MEHKQVELTIDDYENFCDSDCEDPSPKTTTQRRPDIFEAFARNGMKIPARNAIVANNIINSIIRTFLLPLAPQARISAIHCNGNDLIWKARAEAFNKLAKAVADISGGGFSGNLRYAWFGGSAEDLSRIVTCGFSSHADSSSSHGLGIQLTPLQLLPNCLASLVPDEHGMKHILLCRVILGKPEEIPADSKQFHPSSMAFHSGVDNLRTPSIHIVWDAFMNSHIYPEFIISLKCPPSSGMNTNEGVAVNTNEGVAVNTTGGVTVRPTAPSPNSSNQVINATRSASGSSRWKNGANPRVISSPLISYIALLSILLRYLDRPKVSILQKSYEEFRKHNITRLQLIHRTRQIAGDALLTEIVKNHKNKLLLRACEAGQALKAAAAEVRM